MQAKNERPFEMKKARLKAAQSAFGLASSPYTIDLKPGHSELVQVEIPLDVDLCRKREVNPATVRLFRWDAGVERFRMVEASGIGERWQCVRARISVSGLYVAAGAASNPWVEHAVATLRTFGALLHDHNIGRVIREQLCPALLCPGMLGGVFEHIGPPRDRGLPPPPGRDICEICLGGNLGHAVDLYPEPSVPPGVVRHTPCDFVAYVRANPGIVEKITWHDRTWSDRAVRGYDAWSDAEKAALATAFDTIRAGGETGLPEAAPVTTAHPEALHRLLAPEDAWRAFIAHVAHTLVVDSCGWMDWSLADYSDDELRLLLDSESLFSATLYEDYAFKTSVNGLASHGDPTRVYRWLRHEGLIASDHLATIGRVLDWCRDHLSHYTGSADPDIMYDYWQYRGLPPVERMIRGTERLEYPEWGARHWTAGCLGTSGFLRAVLRTINIPATFVTTCEHGQPFFPTIARYLSHGDDPYDRDVRESGIAGTELLIDKATFDAWFDPSVPNRCDNVGRRARELTEGD